ncbi:MAG TPA: hypothetical protein VHP36_00800 [Chitinispirillaceae bacterium]|nr:hypothetical protein [Chitinispirillaceae bacterium]
MLRTIKTSVLFGMLALCGYAFADESNDETSPIYPGYDMCRSREVVVTTNSGEVIKGVNKAANKFKTTYKNLKVKDESGTVHKYKPIKNLKEVTVKSWSVWKGALRRPDRDIRYVTIDIIGKPGKKTMVQQLNYEGTDKILIYNDPLKSKWKTIPVVGITYLSVAGFYISLNGGELFPIDSKTYKKGGFEKIFGNCEAVTSKFATPKDREFDNFRNHLRTFLDSCN